MDKKPAKYRPALRFDWLTSFYDPVARWTTREITFKRALVKQAQIQKGHRILDLGCGTATLLMMIKQMHPEAEAVGIDGDPKILRIAREKVARAGLDITLTEGMAFELPYNNNSFDRVVSSLVFHHLSGENKKRALKEIFRVLRPSGELHLADLGKPANIPMYLISLFMRWFEETRDNVEGRLPEMFREAGFDQVEEANRFSTLFGTLSLYKARKPSLLQKIAGVVFPR